jgi:hypothetical protein
VVKREISTDRIGGRLNERRRKMFLEITCICRFSSHLDDFDWWGEATDCGREDGVGIVCVLDFGIRVWM